MIWKYVNHVNPNSINPHKVLQWLSPNTSQAAIAQLSQSISTHGKLSCPKIGRGLEVVHWASGARGPGFDSRGRRRAARAFSSSPLPSFFEEVLRLKQIHRPFTIQGLWIYIWSSLKKMCQFFWNFDYSKFVRSSSFLAQVKKTLCSLFS